MDSWRRPGAARIPDEIRKAADAFLKKIDGVYPQFGTPPSEMQALGAAGFLDTGTTRQGSSITRSGREFLQYARALQ